MQALDSVYASARAFPSYLLPPSRKQNPIFTQTKPPASYLLKIHENSLIIEVCLRTSPLANTATFLFRGMMMRSLLVRFASGSNLYKPMQLNHQRGMHSRNKKAMEYIAKGWSALKEVDRVIDYCELKDKRLIPWLRTAKENFELALEADNSNTHARYWLSKLHFKYHVPGACKAIGAALLIEAAEMGDPDALYDLGCRLRVENDYVQSDQQAFYYIEKAVDLMHPGALYLLGCVYLAGDCVKKDVASALWCFHRASERGHAGAAIAYGSVLLRGGEVPEAVTKFIRKGRSIHKSKRIEVGTDSNPLELAKKQFEIAAKAGCDLGFRWLERLEEEEKRVMASSVNLTE